MDETEEPILLTLPNLIGTEVVVELVVEFVVLEAVELIRESNPLIAWETMLPLGSEASCQNMQPVLNPLCL